MISGWCNNDNLFTILSGSFDLDLMVGNTSQLFKCFGRTNKKYFIEDLIEACNEALNEFNGMNKNTGERSSVKRRQIFDNIKYMESEAGSPV